MSAFFWMRASVLVPVQSSVSFNLVTVCSSNCSVEVACTQVNRSLFKLRHISWTRGWLIRFMLRLAEWWSQRLCSLYSKSSYSTNSLDIIALSWHGSTTTGPTTSDSTAIWTARCHHHLLLDTPVIFPIRMYKERHKRNKGKSCLTPHSAISLDPHVRFRN
jgi:hypothetical protein